MNKMLWMVAGLLLLCSGFALREWLVREEISTTQAQLKTQLSEMLKSASTRERLQEINTSSMVFDKFITPVFEATNRLLFPGSRLQSLLEWAKGVHSDIAETLEARNIQMKSQFYSEIKAIRASSNPSVDRMMKVLKKAEELQSEQTPSQLAADEMRDLKEFGQKRDDMTLMSVKSEGLKRLQDLRKLLKKADHKRMGEYLSSGQFVKEIQQPAIELILQIRQEEVRKQAWTEFRAKLNDILSHRSVQLHNVARRKKEKEFERLFEEPMAQLFEQEEQPIVIPAPSAPAPSAAIAPSDQDLYNEPELSNPSDSSPGLE